MEIKRTANAGVLLTLDGTAVLLDGVCNSYPRYSYIGTPDAIRKELMDTFPDVLAYTHWHEDHYDPVYAKAYKEKTLRLVYGPELSVSEKIGNIRLMSVKTKHIGRYSDPHVSYIISGSKCVWFMGDASPLVWKNIDGLPEPDAVIVPYAYAITESAWHITKGFGAKNIILLHFPEKNNDPYRLRQTAEEITQGDPCLHIPEIGQTVIC